MNYIEIANSLPLFLVTITILLVLTAQAITFFLIAKKRSQELNIDKAIIRKAIKASAITTVVPSIAIIIGLISLAPVLGLPVSWARLGMAGSMMYELTVAAIGAQTMGTSLGAETYTAAAFANSVWLMTVGILPAFIMAVLFLKKYKKTLKTVVSKDRTKQTLILTTILVAVQVNFITPSALAGGIPLIAVVVSATLMFAFLTLITKFKKVWLREYALSFSMIGAVVAVIAIGLV